MDQMLAGPYTLKDLVALLWPGVERPRFLLKQAKARGEVTEQRRHAEPGKSKRRKAEFFICAKQMPLDLGDPAP